MEKRKQEEEAKREVERLAKEKILLEQKLKVTEERLKEKDISENVAASLS